jgi:hypothetical protein
MKDAGAEKGGAEKWDGRKSDTGAVMLEPPKSHPSCSVSILGCVGVGQTPRNHYVLFA